MDTVSSDIKDDFKIKAIDDKAVHKICSGQVVLTLANAVKELFENSLDAGSSFIEIRLKEYGSDTIEIIDNGCGIQESNFQALTLKHYTSKLTNFEDLVDVQTYGFRGEALSSLCALSDVTITTRHSEVSVGTKLEFDHDGHIVKKTMISRQVGTTVTVKNLFNTLPVRHKEFNKNIKREFSKMLNCLYAYCLVSENIRILCSNQTNRSKSILISSPQKSQLCDKISNIFGSKQSTNLLEIITCFPTTDVLDEYGLKEYEVVTSDLSINGYVSSCEHGLGRSSADRQFYFINKRPCDLPKLSKLINAIYHSYNRHQFPFIILNINLKKQLVDVNVTPDKRMLLFDKENVLFAVVKASFQKVFESKNGNFDRVLPSLLQSTMDSHTFEIQNIEKSVDDSNTNLESKPEDNIRAKDIKELPATLLSSKINGNLTKVALGLSGFKRSGESLCSSKQKVRSLDNYFNLKSKTNTMEVNSEQSIAVTQMNLISTETCSLNDLPGFCVESSENQETIVCEENIFNQNECDVKVIEDQEDKNLNCLSNKVDSGSICENYLLNNRTRREGKESIAFSMAFLKKYFRGTGEKSAITINCRKFKAKIEPGSNEVAENELKNELNKDMFKKMSIIGQFNLGFIITKYDNDLFIVDQHATDEKYNYEDLKKNVVLDTQRLITPMSLNLSAANEIILDENLGIFVKNGFVFSHTKGDEQNLNKICLVGVPVSKNWTFGKEDIEEMLFMMSDGVNTGEMYRPSRIQQMLASRACRKSVMIGTALTAGIMKKLVYHMAEMDQPWNCPHGRPTIRHLINLECIQTM